MLHRSSCRLVTYKAFGKRILNGVQFMKATSPPGVSAGDPVDSAVALSVRSVYKRLPAHRGLRVAGVRLLLARVGTGDGAGRPDHRLLGIAEDRGELHGQLRVAEVPRFVEHKVSDAAAGGIHLGHCADALFAPHPEPNLEGLALRGREKKAGAYKRNC